MMSKDKFEETITIEHEDRTITGRWVSYLIPMPQSEPIERWHLLVEVEKHSAEREDSDAQECKNNAREEIVARKIDLMREHYGIKNLPCADEKIAMDIIESSWEGKWAGQHDDSYILRTGTVNMILAGVVDSLEINSMLRKLNEEEKLGFNGAILVPWEEERESYAIWEKYTGHKRIIVSDSGIWHCDFCRKFGDEQTKSSIYPCVVEDEKTA